MVRLTFNVQHAVDVNTVAPQWVSPFSRSTLVACRFDVEKALKDVDDDGEATDREQTDEVGRAHARAVCLFSLSAPGTKGPSLVLLARRTLRSLDIRFSFNEAPHMEKWRN